MSAASFQTWLKEHEEKIRPLEKDVCLESWKLATTGKKIHEENVAKLRSQYRQIYADSKTFSKLNSYRKGSENWQPLLKRQLDILWAEFAENQLDPKIIEKESKLEAELEGIYSNFRGSMDEKKVDNNAIRKILKTSQDQKERKGAWLASKQIGEEVIGKLLELVHLRNEGAQKNGFKNFYSMSLELDELSEEKLFTLLGELVKDSDEAFKNTKKNIDKELAKRFQIAPSELRPWHYADPFFQEPPPSNEVNLDPKFQNKDLVTLTKQTYEGLGFQIDDILKNCDLFPREGKDQHAFCTMIGRSKDVRILCNLESNEYWMSTMLHEMGHGIYDYYLDDNLPFFLYGPAHILSTEAIAMLFGRLTQNGSWLHEILDLPEKEVAEIVEACKVQEKRGMLIFLRWVSVMCHFEQALYKDPNQDLNRLWWKMVEKFQYISLGEDRNKPDWAGKLHIALAPVYYQNYILGELMASQLQNYIFKNFLSDSTTRQLANNSKAGKFLREKYFHHGSSLRWDHLIKKATGEELNPKYFLEQFVH